MRECGGCVRALPHTAKADMPTKSEIDKQTGGSKKRLASAAVYGHLCSETPANAGVVVTYSCIVR